MKRKEKLEYRPVGGRNIKKREEVNPLSLFPPRPQTRKSWRYSHEREQNGLNYRRRNRKQRRRRRLCYTATVHSFVGRDTNAKPSAACSSCKRCSPRELDHRSITIFIISVLLQSPFIMPTSSLITKRMHG